MATQDSRSLEPLCTHMASVLLAARNELVVAYRRLCLNADYPFVMEAKHAELTIEAIERVLADFAKACPDVELYMGKL